MTGRPSDGQVATASKVDRPAVAGAPRGVSLRVFRRRARVSNDGAGVAIGRAAYPRCRHWPLGHTEWSEARPQCHPVSQPPPSGAAATTPSYPNWSELQLASGKVASANAVVSTWDRLL